MSRRGLLLTITEPPPHMDEEFNAWYDEEHLAERLAIPGFRSAPRWVAEVPAGAGKYLATYELDSLGVLSSPAYLERFENPTPWTKRCLGRAFLHPAARALLLDAAQSGELITLCELSESAIHAASGIVYRAYPA